MEPLTLLQFLAGAVLLIAGAELLVRGASALAAAVGVSPLVIGLTVVAIGTSAPEIAVSVQAALDGRAAIALGNVVGSNICNVLLILGLSALIIPLAVSQQIVRQEVPVMIGAGLLAWGLAADGLLSRTDGLLLLAVGAGYLVWSVVQSRLAGQAAGEEPAPAASPLGQGALIAVGLGLLVVGARWVVAAATGVAVAMGVSELIVGLTIVAVGTSLPEIATSIMAALRGQRDMAVGNVVGSNIFNLLLVLGAAATLGQGGVSVQPSLLTFDFPLLTAVAVACLPIVFTGHRIDRWEGALFVAYYAAYLLYLILYATAHDALPAYSRVMLAYVAPITAVTLVVLALHAAWAGRRQ